MPSRQGSTNHDLSTARPIVQLPGGSRRITDASSELGTLLAATGDFYRRDHTAFQCTTDRSDNHLRPVNAAKLASNLETVAMLVRIDANGELKPTTCSKGNAELILSSEAFVRELPNIRVISNCPVLVEDSGKLRVACGYDQTTGVLAGGKAPSELGINESRELLNDMLSDFRFATASDHSRAMASIITPALVLGGLLGGRAPLDVGESDQSQSGKGYRHKLTTAVYRAKIATITQRARGGVGSLDESFDQALVAGRAFVAIDNVRGRVDSPAIESFLTEDRYSARVPYSASIEVETKRFIILATSNRAEMTIDLANRSSFVRILKQSANYDFRTYPEGNILDHVRANQPRYLGAVFAIVTAWWNAGKPQLQRTGHDFRDWAQTMGWICQELLDTAPLLEGHKSAQVRASNPHLCWLRDVSVVIQRTGNDDCWLRSHRIAEILDAEGVEIPGVKDGQSMEDPAVWTSAAQQLGRRLGKCFTRAVGSASSEELTVDVWRIERRQASDGKGRECFEYRFSADTPIPAKTPANKPANKTRVSANPEENCVSVLNDLTPMPQMNVITTSSAGFAETRENVCGTSADRLGEVDSQADGDETSRRPLSNRVRGVI